MNNLLIYFHLGNPLAYESLTDLTACIGQSQEIQPRLIFVATIFSAEEAFEHLQLALMPDDHLTVVDAIGGVITTSAVSTSDAFEEIRCSTRRLPSVSQN